MRLTRLLPIVPLAVLAGCALSQPASPATPPVARTPSSSAPSSLPCHVDPAIPFHAAKPGAQDDRANAYDTPETIAAIEKHNAARKAVCP